MIIYFFWYFVFVVLFFILLIVVMFFFLLDGYVAIADKLERLVNLRILTEGTKVYTIVEECLSITRSYINQLTVGHRLRRRRHTDDH